MRIYVSTPITSRKPEKWGDKWNEAYASVLDIERRMRAMKPEYACADFVSTFSFNPAAGISEAEAMGNCIQAVLMSDMVVMDDGWQRSLGCQLELKAAKLYGKEWIFKP